jgi:hypothetical protein
MADQLIVLRDIKLEAVLDNTTADKTLAGESGHKDNSTQSPSLVC